MIKRIRIQEVPKTRTPRIRIRNTALPLLQTVAIFDPTVWSYPGWPLSILHRILGGVSAPGRAPYSSLLLTYTAQRLVYLQVYFKFKKTLLKCCGFGIRCFSDPWIRDGKKSGSGSGMNIPDHISEILETVFWVKNTQILWCGSGSGIRNLFDPGSGIPDPGWKNSDLGSGINIPDPQQKLYCQVKNWILQQCFGSGSGDWFGSPGPGQEDMKLENEHFLTLLKWLWPRAFLKDLLRSGSVKFWYASGDPYHLATGTNPNPAPVPALFFRVAFKIPTKKWKKKIWA